MLGGWFTLIGHTLAPVRDLVTLIRDPLALVRDPVALVRGALALIRDPLAPPTPRHRAPPTRQPPPREARRSARAKRLPERVLPPIASVLTPDSITRRFSISGSES
jgi:hypothetical protein